MGAAGAAAPQGLLTNLISWYELGEASGTRADSVVASANDLTDNNTVTQAVGKVGNAAQFTAANSESLSRADNASLSTGDIDFYGACFVRFDSLTGYQTIAAKGDGGFDGEWWLLKNPDSTPAHKLQFAAFKSPGTQVNVFSDTFGAISANTWYFVEWFHDSVNNLVGLAVNGGAFDTVAHSGGINDSSQAFQLGALVGGSFFMDGRVDQFGFWKQILNASQRSFLYNGGNGRAYADLT